MYVSWNQFIFCDNKAVTSYSSPPEPGAGHTPPGRTAHTCWWRRRRAEGKDTRPSTAPGA